MFLLSFVPVFGLGLIVLAGSLLMLKEKKSWWVWIFGPLFTLMFSFLTGRILSDTGYANMLFAAIFGLFFVFLFVYYPGLVIFWLLKKGRKVIDKKVGDLENESQRRKGEGFKSENSYEIEEKRIQISSERSSG